MLRSLAVFCSILLATITVAFAAMPSGIQVADTSLGKILTDSRGMTLYTTDMDSAGTSTCVDACAKNWPPLAAPVDAKSEGDFSIIVRPDGTSQWAYKGKPLYLWIKDVNPGDMTGEGVRNLWHVARL